MIAQEPRINPSGLCYYCRKSAKSGNGEVCHKCLVAISNFQSGKSNYDPTRTEPYGGEYNYGIVEPE